MRTRITPNTDTFYGVFSFIISQEYFGSAESVQVVRMRRRRRHLGTIQTGTYLGIMRRLVKFTLKLLLFPGFAYPKYPLKMYPPPNHLCSCSYISANVSPLCFMPRFLVLTFLVFQRLTDSFCPW